MSGGLPDGAHLVSKLLTLGRLVRGRVMATRQGSGNLAGVSKVTTADTIYELDTHVEPVVERFCEEWGEEVPLVLVAEGIGEEGVSVYPRGISPERAALRVICDPVDGTRGLMYDKRSAWFLAGVAQNKGVATRLSDIFAAVQVELPTGKQGAGDVLWAVRGEGAHGVREMLWGDAGEVPLEVRPSRATTLEHGFASVANFFPGTKELASRLMERIVEATVGAADVTRGTVFDDQYISTGGQLYELMMGHDRFVADLRPLFYRIRGMAEGMCVHPYDLASVLIAREAGVEITDGMGGELDGPLDVETGMSWAGYANGALRRLVEPVVAGVMSEWLRGGK